MAGVDRRALLLALVLLVGSASAFYLPGVAPHDYNPGEDMRVKVPPSPAEHTPPFQLKPQCRCVTSPPSAPRPARACACGCLRPFPQPQFAPRIGGATVSVERFWCNGWVEELSGGEEGLCGKHRGSLPWLPGPSPRPSRSRMRLMHDTAGGGVELGQDAVALRILRAALLPPRYLPRIDPPTPWHDHYHKQPHTQKGG